MSYYRKKNTNHLAFWEYENTKVNNLYFCGYYCFINTTSKSTEIEEIQDTCNFGKILLYITNSLSSIATVCINNDHPIGHHHQKRHCHKYLLRQTHHQYCLLLLCIFSLTCRERGILTNQCSCTMA